MYLVFIRMPCESYHRRLGSFLLCLCDVFRALINSLVYWICTSALGLVLFHIVTNRQTEYHQNDWQTLGKQVETQLCRAMEPTTKDNPAKVDQVVYRIDTNLTHEVYSGLTFLLGLLLNTWDTTSTSPFVYLLNFIAFVGVAGTGLTLNAVRILGANLISAAMELSSVARYMSCPPTPLPISASPPPSNQPLYIPHWEKSCPQIRKKLLNIEMQAVADRCNLCKHEISLC